MKFGIFPVTISLLVNCLRWNCVKWAVTWPAGVSALVCKAADLSLPPQLASGLGLPEELDPAFEAPPCSTDLGPNSRANTARCRGLADLSPSPQVREAQAASCMPVPSLLVKLLQHSVGSWAAVSRSQPFCSRSPCLILNRNGGSRAGAAQSGKESPSEGPQAYPQKRTEPPPWGPSAPLPQKPFRPSTSQPALPPAGMV